MRRRLQIPQREEFLRKEQRPALLTRGVTSEDAALPEKSAVARVMHLQQQAGNAATQRMLDHRQDGHGKDCTCIACKPQLMKRDSAPAKPTASGPAVSVSQPANGSGIYAAQYSNVTGQSVQRWPWDDDDEQKSDDSGGGTAVATGSATETPSSDSGGDSGGSSGSWWPFGGDDKKEEPAASGGEPAKDDSGGGSWWPFGGGSDKKDDEKGDDSGGGSWWPFGGSDKKDDEKGDDSGGGSWWPFGGGDKKDEKGDDDGGGSWWPFGGGDKKDDEKGGDDDQPGNLPPGVDANDLITPPLSSRVGSGPKEFGAGAIGCQVSDPNGIEVEHNTIPTFPNAVMHQGRPVPVRVKPTIEYNVRETSEATTSGNSWANIGAGATVFQESDEIRDDSIAKPLGSTFPSFQVKDINWTYDSGADVIEISCTFRIEVLWGTNSGGARAVNTAEEPGLSYDDLVRAADEFEAIAKLRDSSNINFKFWNPSLTAGHEMVHVNQLNDLVPDAQSDFVDAVSSLDLQSPPFYRNVGFTDGDKAATDAEVKKLLEQAKKGVMSIMKSKWNSRGNEGPAYAAMSQSNQKLADDLRKRAAHTPPTP